MVLLDGNGQGELRCGSGIAYHLQPSGTWQNTAYHWVPLGHHHMHDRWTIGCRQTSRFLSPVELVEERC